MQPEDVKTLDRSLMNVLILSLNLTVRNPMTTHEPAKTWNETFYTILQLSTCVCALSEDGLCNGHLDKKSILFNAVVLNNWCYSVHSVQSNDLYYLSLLVAVQYVVFLLNLLTFLRCWLGLLCLATALVLWCNFWTWHSVFVAGAIESLWF